MCCRNTTITKFGKTIGNVYSVIWLLVLYFPYLYYYYIEQATVISMFDQLTWWCWSIQVIFYTVALLVDKCSFEYFKDFEISDMDEYDEPIRNCYPQLVDLLSIVTGIVWFVCGMFIYVLFMNPRILVDQMGNDIDGAGGRIQIGNILVHYYIVTGIYVWTLFKYNFVNRRVDYFLKTGKYAWFRLLCNWLLIPLFYLSYWKFDIHGIAENYWIEDENLGVNIGIGILVLFFTTTSQLVYYSSFSKYYEQIDPDEFEIHRRRINGQVVIEMVRHDERGEFL